LGLFVVVSLQTTGDMYSEVQTKTLPIWCAAKMKIVGNTTVTTELWQTPQ